MAPVTRARKTPAEETVEAAPAVVSLPRPTADGVEFDEVPVAELPDEVELMSPYSELMLPLIPEVSYPHPVTGQRVVQQQGVTLRFQMGRCKVRRDLMPLVADCPHFSGRGQKTVVFLADDPRAYTNAFRNPRVVTGAQTATPMADQANAPIRGWDSLSPAEIQQAVAEGRVKDPMGALAFEFRPGNGKRREAVKNILWRASLGDDAEIPVEEIAADAVEVMPAGERRV